MVSVGIFLATYAESLTKQSHTKAKPQSQTGGGGGGGSADVSLEVWLYGLMLLTVALFLSSVIGHLQVKKKM